MECRAHSPAQPRPPLSALRNIDDSNAGIRAADTPAEELDHGGSGPHILCVACGSRVARSSHRIAVNGSHEHSFFNPAGLVFELGCFSAAPGCSTTGAACFEFTWFPGHSWQIALCAACRNHLGWRYAAPGGSAFFGLILAQLVEERQDDP